MNCVGIFDILSFDASQANPLSMMPHYQVGFPCEKDCIVITGLEGGRNETGSIKQL